MTTEQFLSIVLPHAGQWCLVLLMPDGKPVHRWFPAGDSGGLLGMAQWGVRKRADAYVAIAGYSSPDDGEMRRKATYAQLHRSLRVDIDCGPDKPYATKRDGWHALVAFCQRQGLPEPTVVDSGGGLHVYWSFTEDLAQLRWLKIASGLQSACATQGLQIDTTATMDAARILRLPGTSNFKGGGERPVRLLYLAAPTDPDVLEAALPYHAPVVLPGAGPTPGLNDDLTGGMYPVYTLREVLTGCPGMRGMLATQGANAQEPLWKAALDLINKAEGTPEQKWRVATAVSQGHPSYSEGVLATKWQQTQEQDYHPPTCSKFAQLGMPECASCPLRAAIKSPVSVGRVNAAGLNLQPAPPPPPVAPAAAAGQVAMPVPQTTQHGCFMLGSGTTVKVVDGLLTGKLAIKDGQPHRLTAMKLPDDDGNVKEVETWMPIIPFKITEVERLLEATCRQMVVNITFDAFTDGVRKVAFTNQTLHDGKAFAQTLAGAGLSMNSLSAKSLQDQFMPDFLTSLQKVRSANLIAGRCGWTDDKTGFVLGRMLYTNGAAEPVYPTHDGAASIEMEGYHSQGEDAKAAAAIALAIQNMPERQAVVALSIASPLMEFTGVDGVILNAWSIESGIGKSTLCDAALAIWGDPNRLRKDFRDTANATWKLASVIGNLPMVIDEFTNIDGRALSDYVYTVTQGREKHRLTSSSALSQNANRWRLAAITTANNSVHDKLLAYRPDAVAEAARVFELRLSPIQLTAEQIAASKPTFQHLRTNFGHIGPQLVQMLLSKPPAYWAELVHKRIAWWDREVANGTTDRFRSACAALIEIGAHIGKGLGLPFDPAAVVAEVRRQWTDQTQSFEDAKRDPEDYITDFIAANTADVAVVGGQSGNDLLTPVGRRYVAEIRGRSVNGKFRRETVVVPLNNLKDWIKDRNGNWKAFHEWLKQQEFPGGLVQKHGRGRFLYRQLQEVRTVVVEFSPVVLGDTIAVDKVVSELASKAATP